MMLKIQRDILSVCFTLLVACGCSSTNIIHSNTQDKSSSTMLPLRQGTNSSMIITKQTHTIETFETYGGKTISPVHVGWESYGELNAAKDNVVLITHYFTGNSHAAGKYHASDEELGYWDAIIGPNKAIDTNKFFVISVDSLVNISAFDENVITTGPSSINPATGKPYGLSFPVVTMRDFVNVQKSVLESLGITKLYAVAGPSMGSMQAIEWASAYPQWVERLISVIGSGGADAWNTALLEQWVAPITLDPNFAGGNYYDKPKSQWPNAGLIQSLALITQSALHPEFFNEVGKQIGYSAKETAPFENIMAKPSMVTWLLERAASRSGKMDANHLLYLVRANQLFTTGMKGSLLEGLKAIQAKVLLLPSSTDQLLMPYHAEKIAKGLESQNKEVTLEYLNGDPTRANMGHLEGVAGIVTHASTIRAFLNE